MSVAISPKPTEPQLSRFITEIPHKIADEQGRKAALYSLASKVCVVAFVAIAVTVLSISVGFLLPLNPMLTLGLVLSTLPLQIGLQTFMIRSIDCSHKAQIAKEKAKELARIQHWTKPQIEAFFKKHKLSLEKLPMNLLHQLNPKEPLSALLPAIAFCNYLCKEAKKQFDLHKDNLNNKLEDPILHHEGRRIGWKKLEFEAIPTALQAAFVLQTISQPTLQMTLDDLGTCHAKPFDQRCFDQLLDGTDEYFVFKDEKRPALTCAEAQEMLSKQNIDGLRIKLFS